MVVYTSGAVVAQYSIRVRNAHRAVCRLNRLCLEYTLNAVQDQVVVEHLRNPNHLT